MFLAYSFFFDNDINNSTFTVDISAKDTLVKCNKPYIISISGKSVAENLQMLERIYSNPTNIAAIEVNFACPNILGKPIVAYDF